MLEITLSEANTQCVPVSRLADNETGKLIPGRSYLIAAIRPELTILSTTSNPRELILFPSKEEAEIEREKLYGRKLMVPVL